MKHYIIIHLFFMCSTICLAQQKEYSFDTMLEYEFQANTTSKKEVVYFFINQKDDSYYLKVTKKDSAYFLFKFKKYRSFISKFEVLQSDFTTTQKMMVGCDYIHRFHNPYIRKAKKYAVVQLKDSTIDYKSYNHYVIKSKKSRLEKRKKLGRIHFITDKTMSFYPSLVIHDTGHELLTGDTKFIKGGIREKFFVDYKGNKTSIYKLQKVKPIKRTLLIPLSCDYKFDIE